jgi:copper homeostasis protein
MRELEIACFNLQSALIAQEGGADRIELCDNFAVGGTTPSLEIVKEAREKINIPLFVMIRPRGGNFFYDEFEFNEMKNSISIFKNVGVDGFVFGILNKDNTIDVVRNKVLVDIAGQQPCTFHRAFDKVSDMNMALASVIQCGFKTILTSGLKANAMEGKENLRQLILNAGDKICVMPGGSVRSSTIQELKQDTNAFYYHSSAIINGDIADLTEIIELKKKLA